MLIFRYVSLSSTIIVAESISSWARVIDIQIDRTVYSGQQY